MPFGRLTSLIRKALTTVTLAVTGVVLASVGISGFHQGLHAGEDLSAHHAAAQIQVEQLPCQVCTISRSTVAGQPVLSPSIAAPIPTATLSTAAAVRAVVMFERSFRARAPPTA
jgi:hypothetical protein